MEYKKYLRKDWLDIARGFSIILVVLYHVDLWFDDFGFGVSYFIKFDKAFRAIRMPLFFFVSGYLLNLTNKNGDLHYVRKRSILFVYLYGIWGLIDWVFAYTLGLTSPRVTFGTSIFQLFSMWYQPETGLWFIWSLIIYNTIIEFTYKFSPIKVILIFAALSVTAMSKYLSLLNFAQISAIYYAPFFLAGLHYGRYIEKFIVNNLPTCAWFASFAYVGINLSILQLDPNGFFFGFTRFLDCVVGALLGCCMAIITSKFTAPCSFIGGLGRQTLQIYLPHETLAAILTLFFIRCVHQPGISKVFFIPFAVIITIYICILIYRVAISLGLNVLYQRPSRVLNKPANGGR